MQEEDICVNWLESVYFTEQNIMQRRDPIEVNFEGLEMQK